MHCRPSVALNGSYEDLEMSDVKPELEEGMEEGPEPRRISMRRLARQQSVMDTQKTADGTMNMTYWF